ncbi:hypothetical protein PIB30_010367 [Stylosanthes scabra]|uniref:Uncharacterized protein n=1 Tax=Stylosanthes scabra TaxID=79078 RepID=A0ABU6W3H0_9FABA|nr:hypothetical protein [Stylosanthes scabra]
MLFKGGSTPPQSMKPFDGERAQQRLQVSRISGGKYSVGRMNMDHRLLQYMLSYIWLPRKGNHGALIEEDLIILWAMAEAGLGHEMLWTKVFAHSDIDLSGEDAVPIDDENAITSRHLNKMGRGLKAVVEEDERDEAANEDDSPQPGVGSVTQFPPELIESFSQGMQSFRTSWGENIQRMNRRLDDFEARLTTRANEIRDLGDDMHRFYNRALQSEDQGFQGSALDQD